MKQESLQAKLGLPFNLGLVFALWLGCGGGFGVPAKAQAQGYLGVQAGLSVPDANDTTSRPVFGFTAGARLNGEFGLGGYFSSSSKKESLGNTERNFNYHLYGIEGSFHFEGVADGAYVGLRVGISKVKVGTVEVSPSHYGAIFGYDYFVNPNWSVGVETGYMKIEGASKGSENIDGFGALHFAASTKVWF